MGYSSDYVNNVGRIYSELGRGQAEAKLRSGAAWAGAIGEIGQTIANLPGQLADQKRQAAQQAIWDANLKKLQQQDQEDQWLSSAMNSSVVDGKIDERRLTENLTLLGAAQLAPAAVKVIRETESALLQLQNLRDQGQINEATLGKLVMDYLAPFAAEIKKSDFDPGVVNGALAAIAIQSPEMAKRLAERFAQNPAGIRGMVEELTRPQAGKPLEVGGVLLDPNQIDPTTGQPRVLFDSRTPAAPKTLSLDDQLAEAFKSGDRATVNAIVKLKAEIAAGTRAPVTPAGPKYERIETIENGRPVVKFLTAEEVRASGGVPTAPKVGDKGGASTVEALLVEIEDLSKSINTASGVSANVKGAIRQAKSSLNLDNEVSEYERLITGFIPVMARAVGHTGVLTQMDVDSVRALFPRVGDNETLAVNLIARVRRLMTALQDPRVSALGPNAPFSEKLAAAAALTNQGRASGAGPVGASSGRASGAGPSKAGAVDPLGIRVGGGG